MVAPDPEELARLDLEVIPQLMRRMAMAVAEGSGCGCGSLSMTQVRVLKRLANGAQLGSDLAQQLGITPPTVSAVIDGLVRRGLVERGETPEDRRLVPLKLTPEGRRRYEAVCDRMIAALAGIMGQIEPEERAALEIGLRALARVVFAQSNPPIILSERSRNCPSRTHDYCPEE